MIKASQGLSNWAEVKTRFGSLASFVGLTACLFFGSLQVASAATQAQIDASFQSGLAWLVTQQQGDGSWAQSRPIGTTALCLGVLGHDAEREGLSPLDPVYTHSSRMQNGLNYIFSQAYHDAANQRVWFGNATESSADNYVIGPSLMAIVLSATPDRVVNVPGGSAVDGLTYLQVAQRIVNFLVHHQIKDGAGRGSWYYTPASQTGDLSISGWITLGLGYARDRFGIELPQTMINHISAGVDLMQQTADANRWDYGGAGYTSSGGYSNWINSHKVGHLLYILYLVGDDATSLRVQRSVGFLERHWNSPTSGSSGGQSDPGWRGNPPSLLPSYIGTVTVMKGLVAHAYEELQVNGSSLDWFDDMTTVLDQ